MSFLYIKTELSAKIFEYDIIKEQFENIFTKNADKILKKYEYYLNITNKNIVFNETYMGKEVILEIEVNGAQQVREQCKDAVFIFLVPPTRKALYDRLKSRGTESEEKIKARIAKADREFKLAHQYDYIVVNDEVHNAADRIMAIIRSEHAKTFRSIHQYLKLIEEEK